MAKAQKGYILIADISGYTRFLTESELEHAHEIIRELLTLVKDRMGAPIQVIRSEGDALFGYLPVDSLQDAYFLLDFAESGYHAFQDRLLHVEKASTCDCNACRNTRDLDLKFFAHFAEFIVEDLGGGRPDLSGPEVVLAHRLLKNQFIEKHGIPAYFMVTDPVYLAMGQPRDSVDHFEEIEHFGHVDLHVFDLKEALERRREKHRVIVVKDHADYFWEYTFDAPRETVWAHATDPGFIAGGPDDDTTGWTWEGDRRHSGAEAHCAHGDGTTSVMAIADWTPMEHYTLHTAAQGWVFPEMHLTYHFVAIGQNRTMVCVASRLLKSNVLQRGFMWTFSGQWKKHTDASMERLKQLCARRLEAAPKAAERAAVAS